MCVSIIIPAYNAEKSINQCLDSIYRQNNQDIEVIIVDDGSTDATLELIKSHKLDCVVLRNHNNMGLAVCVNLGVSVSTHEVILRLDADDYLLDGALDTVVREFSESAADLMSFGILSGKKVYTEQLCCREIYKILRYRNPIYHPTVIMNKSALEKVGGYNEDLRRAQDYELWQRMKLHAMIMVKSKSITIHHSPSIRNIKSLLSELKTNIYIAIRYKSPLIIPYSVIQLIKKCINQYVK